MADGDGRIRTRTAMLEISWLLRGLEGVDASFWSANACVCVEIYFCWVVRFFWLTLFFGGRRGIRHMVGIL